MITIGKVSMNIDFQESDVMSLLHGAIQWRHKPRRKNQIKKINQIKTSGPYGFKKLEKKRKGEKTNEESGQSKTLGSEGLKM